MSPDVPEGRLSLSVIVSRLAIKAPFVIVAHCLAIRKKGKRILLGWCNYRGNKTGHSTVVLSPLFCFMWVTSAE